MSSLRRQILRLLAVLLAACCGLTPAWAQFPDKPVKLLVGFAPGGSVDVVARLLAQEMSKSLGQPVVVENRPGASTAIAASAVAKAAPDGYTLMLMSSTNAIAPALAKAPTYRPLTDFTPISVVATGPIVIAVKSDSPLRTLGDAITAARAKPGALTYGAGGSATSMHLSALLLQKELGLSMLHVPFKGGSETLTALLSDQINLQFGTPSSLMSQLGNRVRAIAVTSVNRFPDMPTVPTVAESGLPGFDVSVWYMLAAPAGLPAPVAARLNTAVREALAAPEVRKRLASEGFTAAPSSPQQAMQLLQAEVPRWAAVVKAANLREAD